MKKKIISLCLVIALVAIAIVGGTLAYFTDTDAEMNTFTVGKVNIAIEETFVQDSMMFPGVAVEKKVAVKVEADSEDSWVWVTYTIPTEFYNMIDLTFAPDTAWSAQPVKSVGDNTVVTFLYDTEEPVSANTTTDLNLTAVTLKADVYLSEDGTTLKMDGVDDYVIPTTGLPIAVNAYAIQAAGIADVNAAYTAYNSGN